MSSIQTPGKLATGADIRHFESYPYHGLALSPVPGFDSGGLGIDEVFHVKLSRSVQSEMRALQPRTQTDSGNCINGLIVVFEQLQKGSDRNKTQPYLPWLTLYFCCRFGKLAHGTRNCRLMAVRRNLSGRLPVSTELQPTQDHGRWVMAPRHSPPSGGGMGIGTVTPYQLPQGVPPPNRRPGGKSGGG